MNEDHLSEKVPDSPLGLTVGQRAQSMTNEWLEQVKERVAAGADDPGMEVPPSRRSLRNARRRVIE